MRKVTATKRLLSILLCTIFVTFSVSANWFVRAEDSTAHAKRHAPISIGACATCSPGTRSGASSLAWPATLGLRTQVTPLSPVIRSGADGVPVNFVSTATGNLAFSMIDIQLPGVLPIMFQRTYSSSNSPDQGLGQGWSFVYDDRIAVNGDSATMTTNASTISFKREGTGSHFVLAVDEPMPHQSFDLAGAGAISETVMGLTRTYQKAGGTYRLANISDRNGNAISISLDPKGNIAGIKNSSGSSINLQWSQRGSNLLSVTDSQQRTISFLHSGGSLSGTIDAAGGRWTNTYAGGLLTGITDPAGRALLRATFDQFGRATVSSNAAGTYHFGYDQGSAIGGQPVSRKTLVTDPMGSAVSFEHNERGAIVGTNDGAGGWSKIEYNSVGRQSRLTDSSGGDTTITYDGQKRLVRFSANDGGGDLTPNYDQGGNLVSISRGDSRADITLDKKGNTVGISGDVQQGYTAELNSRGQAVSLVSPSGRTVKLEYDAAGAMTALTAGKGGRIGYTYDSAGRLTSKRLSARLTETYTYDSRGLLLKKTTSLGRSKTFERDASGALMRTVNGHGKGLTATRDQAGRITSLTRSNGKSRSYAYNAVGAVTDYVDARGRHTVFQYDRAGRLIGSTVVSQTIQDGNRGFMGKFAASAAVVPVNVKYSPGASTRGAAVILQDCLEDSDDSADFEMSGATTSEEEDCGGDDDDDDDGGGGGDDDDSGGGETCAQCTDRNNSICTSANTACALQAAGITLIAQAACLGLLAIPIAGLGLYAACLAITIAADIAMSASCVQTYNGCVLGIPDKCPMC
jgi:YD repeat-containing protein